MSKHRDAMAGPPPEGWRVSNGSSETVVDLTYEEEEAAEAARDRVAMSILNTAISPCDDGTCDCVPNDQKKPPKDDLDEVRTTSATGGQKGVKLARFDLIPVGPLTELAKHYGRGALKYDDNNWRKGYEWSKNYAALQRHMTAFWAGEDIDPETGTPHVIAAAWHAFALAEFMTTHPEFDDRP